jgi:ABC-type transport system involved in multi-copper enzyme maturation permease subunit
MRLGAGPVFVYECITAARRWQVYALRALCVLGLLAAMIVVWVSDVASQNPATIQAYAHAGEYYFLAICGTSLALILLAAPAFAAGAICLDRARGTLAHVLVTDLTDAEIVLGKLGARLVPVLSLVACTLPVLSLGALLGGIDPFALAMAFLVVLAVALLGCVLALTISVWADKTHEVLMAVYAWWTVALLFYPVWRMLAMAGTGLGGPPQWLLKLNPVWLTFSPYLAPNEVQWSDFALFIGGSLALSALLTVVSIARLRPVTITSAGRSSRAAKSQSQLSPMARLRRLLPGPSLDRNPVLWREWHRNQPARLARLIWWAYFGSLTYGSVYSLVEIYQAGVPRGPNLGALVVLLGVGLGLLLMSVTASSSLAEERSRGSLDVLLSTPLSTATIVWGKWCGAFRVAPLVAIWPTVMIAGFAFAWPGASWAGRGMVLAPISDGVRLVSVMLMALLVLVHGAAITSLGLALATWIPRQGRAVGLCVSAYVMVSVGWMILIFSLISGPRRAEPWLTLSPIFASVNLCEAIALPNHAPVWTLAITSFWLMAVAAAAAVLLLLAYVSFDLCLGRMPDDFSRPPAAASAAPGAGSRGSRSGSR